MAWHVERVHERKNRKQCPHCDHTACTDYNLKTHIASVHEGQKRHKCSICEKKFFQKSKLIRHLAVHEPKKNHTM